MTRADMSAGTMERAQAAPGSSSGGSFLSRQERLPSVGSTNDLVRGWLAEGTPEVCLAVADEQTAGRGRNDRSWFAPPGKGLLLSAGFRPTYLPPERAWRLAAIVALAMADAAEAVAGLRDGAIKLKWPNDLVVEAPEGSGSAGRIRKLGGVLGETEGLGGNRPVAVVGIGVNVDWPSAEFPPELTAEMTSLREIAGRPVDREDLLDGFLLRLEPRLLALRDGRFDIAGWVERQVTTGGEITLELPDGAQETVRAVGVDGAGGGLVVEDCDAPGGERSILVGEVRHVRLRNRV